VIVTAKDPVHFEFAKASTERSGFDYVPINRIRLLFPLENMVRSMVFLRGLFTEDIVVLLVVLEKPVCASSAEVRELISISKQNNVVFAPYHNRRFDGDFVTIKSLIQEGKVGLS
jgi:hypothetical protein